MDQWNDAELLSAYVNRQSEAAFEVLVERYVALVYSAARRQAYNPQLAEEVTQAVFILLAQKARRLNRRTPLSGWLCRAVYYVARNALKAEFRRQFREKEVYMQSLANPPEMDAWQQFAPMLDEAVAQLSEADRNAVVLRFYQKKPLNEVGVILGVKPDAAQKRVSRALDKLRRFFARRGVTSSAATIAGTISVNSIQAAPVGLAKTISAAALAKGAATSTSTLTLVKGALKLMAWNKAKTAIVVGVVALVATGTTTLIVKKAVDSGVGFTAERIFEQPDARSMGLLESALPTLIVRPTRYPDKHQGYWDSQGKGMFDGATFSELIAWAYGGDPMRVILPGDAPTGYFDYLNTMPGNRIDALREVLKKQFGLVATREMPPTDVLLLTVQDPFQLSSFRTRGGPFACYGTGRGDIQTRCFTNASLSLFAAQDVEGYFEKPCILRTDPDAKYDFAFHWTEPKGLTGEERKEALRPIMEDQIRQLGLELIPTNMPIEMLVVEKAR